MGKLNVPLLGMIDSMSTTINFLTVTQAAANLGSPGKHLLDLRVAEEFWEVQQADVGLWAEKIRYAGTYKKLIPGYRRAYVGSRRFRGIRSVLLRRLQKGKTAVGN